MKLLTSIHPLRASTHGLVARTVFLVGLLLLCSSCAFSVSAGGKGATTARTSGESKTSAQASTKGAAKSEAKGSAKTSGKAQGQASTKVSGKTSEKVSAKISRKTSEKASASTSGSTSTAATGQAGATVNVGGQVSGSAQVKKKPASKKPAPKPASEKPASKKPAPKPASEKPASKKPAPKPASEKPASKKPAPKPASKKPAPKPDSKKPEPPPGEEKPATTPTPTPTPVPAPVPPPAEPVAACLIGTEKVDLRDRTTTTASVAAGQFELGVDAKLVGSLAVTGSAFLRERAVVQGTARIAGEYKTQNLVKVQKLVHPASVDLPHLESTSISASTEHQFINNNEIKTLSPGSYGHLTIRARSQVTFEEGIYSFASLTIEPDVKITLEGKVAWLSEGDVKLESRVDYHLQAGATLSLYSNGSRISLHPSQVFPGVITAPRGLVEVFSKVETRCIAAKSVRVEPDSSVTE